MKVVGYWYYSFFRPNFSPQFSNSLFICVDSEPAGQGDGRVRGPAPEPRGGRGHHARLEAGGWGHEAGLKVRHLHSEQFL